MGFGTSEMNGTDIVFAIFEDSSMTIKDYNGTMCHNVTEDDINDITKVSHSVSETTFNVVFQRKLDTSDSNNTVLVADGYTSF